MARIATLPVQVNGLSPTDLADIATAVDPCPDEFVGVGYWPEIYDRAGSTNSVSDLGFVHGRLNQFEDAVNIGPKDMPNVWSLLIALTLYTREEADAVMAGWPRA